MSDKPKPTSGLGVDPPADYVPAADHDSGTTRGRTGRDNVELGLKLGAAGLLAAGAYKGAQLAKSVGDMVDGATTRIEAHAASDAMTNTPPPVRIDPALPERKTFDPKAIIEARTAEPETLRTETTRADTSRER